MYHTPLGIRVLTGAERQLFVASLATIVEQLSLGDDFLIRGPLEGLQANQKIAVLHTIARALLCEDEPPPKLTASIEAAETARGLDQDHWLCPLADERKCGAERVGLLEGFSLGSYLELVDWTSRLVRKGKARVTAEVASLLDRLGTSAEQWQLTMGRLFLRPRAVGVAFAFHRERLQEAAVKRGCHHLANLNGCPT